MAAQREQDSTFEVQWKGAAQTGTLHTVSKYGFQFRSVDFKRGHRIELRQSSTDDDSASGTLTSSFVTLEEFARTVQAAVHPIRFRSQLQVLGVDGVSTLQDLIDSGSLPSTRKRSSEV